MLTNPSNSYTGGTVVNGWINGPTGGLVVNGSGLIPAGGLTINNSTVTTTAAGQIDPANVVTIGASSTLTLVGNNTLAGLNFENFGGVANAAVNMGAGVLTLTGGINASSSNVSTLPVLNGIVDFSGGNRTFNIAPISYNSANLNPLQPTINIAGVIQNAGRSSSRAAVICNSAARARSRVESISSRAAS